MGMKTNVQHFWKLIGTRKKLKTKKIVAGGMITFIRFSTQLWLRLVVAIFDSSEADYQSKNVLENET